MTYDVMCLVLARHFLTDEPASDESDAADLAQDIQGAVEDWLEFTLPSRIAARRDRAIDEARG